MVSIVDDFDLNLEDFDFEELLIEEERSIREYAATAESETEEPQTGKRKLSIQKSEILGTRRKRKVNTIIQLPAAVRSTQFAQFMLHERFMAKPEDYLQGRPDLKLYSFPRFNRCDGLMYFPSTLVSFLNNQDLSSLSSLFNTFFHRSCSVVIEDTSLMGNPASPSRYIEFQKLLNEMHPDKFMCMHSTKEVGNEIRANLYFKLTEYKFIYESVARSRRHPHFAPLLVPSRAEHLKTKFDLSSLPEERWNQLSSLLDSGADVELLGRIDLRLVFNKHSKLIHEMKLMVEFTDFRRVDTYTFNPSTVEF